MVYLVLLSYSGITDHSRKQGFVAAAVPRAWKQGSTELSWQYAVDGLKKARDHSLLLLQGFLLVSLHAFPVVEYNGKDALREINLNVMS